MKIARGLMFAAVVLLYGCSEEDPINLPSASVPSPKPNILLIVTDDMAFSDLGSFGGEIETPNLDGLANAGIRFTNFHGAPMCSPSRAMMLTGLDPHRVGFGNMKEELSPNQIGQAGYEGFLTKQAVTLPAMLRTAGYRTMMAGKWHLGSGPESGPSFRGFDRSFALDSGGASHFADMRPAYAPSPEIKANYSAEGTKLSELPSDFEYSSQYYVDRLIGYLSEDPDAAEPFFAYLAFTAPHWPIQAPDAAVARQTGRYDEGYDALADKRLARAKELGLIADTAERAARSPKERPWDALSEEEKRVEIRAMEIYAAMIAEIDFHTGRLLEFLRAQNLLDNTIVVFLSDNGAEGHDLDETWPADAFPDIRRTIDESHDFSYENMGRPGSYTLYGPNWANAAAPALYLHKGFPTEGGTRVPAFVYFPEQFPQPKIVRDFVSIQDVTPTLLELTGVAHPGKTFEGRSIYPITGQSFASVLRTEDALPASRVTGMELMGKRAIRMGDWKLVHMPPPHGAGAWQLFNVAQDVSETRDIASENPDLVTEMKRHWDAYAKSNGVILPDWVSGY